MFHYIEEKLEMNLKSYEKLQTIENCNLPIKSFCINCIDNQYWAHII
jgi:hypothetical protein